MRSCAALLALVLTLPGVARANSGGRSTFRIVETPAIEGNGARASLVLQLAYENPGAAARAGKPDGNVARFFVHERPPYTINTGGGWTNLEVAAGKPIGEVVMTCEVGLCTLKGKLGELGLQRGKQYYLAAYWPGILGGDGNGHRWGVANNNSGGNAPVSFVVPGEAKQNALLRQRGARPRWPAAPRWLGAAPWRRR